jgi:hypothetical protein
LCGATSSFLLDGMDAIERRVEFPHHLAKARVERGAPPDQNVIVAGMQLAGIRKPYDFPQTAPYPVTLDRLADVARHCEADAHGALVGAPAGLQHEGTAGHSRAGGSGRAKIRAALQSLQP